MFITILNEYNWKSSDIKLWVKLYFSRTKCKLMCRIYLACEKVINFVLFHITLVGWNAQKMGISKKEWFWEMGRHFFLSKASRLSLHAKKILDYFLQNKFDNYSLQWNHLWSYWITMVLYLYMLLDNISYLPTNRYQTNKLCC